MIARTALASLSLSGLVIVAASCGGEAPPEAKAPTPAVSTSASASAAPSVSASIAAPKPYTPKPVRFENPGGMWMPSQMRAHEAKLRELGLAIDPSQLSDPTSDVLGAVVFLGGCSASFVSPEGLVITNHHCAVGALQLNSSPTANLLHDGFVAKSRADEKSNGPSARVMVTQKVSDVTSQIIDDKTQGKLGDRARYLAIESAEKKVVEACEKGRPGIRCNVASFYEGAAYYLIEQLEIRDVRLVYAPAEGVGDFGGEIDNFRWPRHAGDVAIYRAYVGKDGQPADYSPDNVPYASKKHLKIASKPLREGDLVFVAGYPGRTNSLKNAVEVEEYVGFRYPHIVKLAESILAVLDKLTDADAKIRATPLVRGYGNTLTNYKGQLEGLSGGLAKDKAAHEAALQKWIDGDPARKKKWGAVIAEIDKAYADNRKHRLHDFELSRTFSLPRLLGAANAIVRMAEERAKADKDRNPTYQERNWPRLVQGQQTLEKQYSRKVDVALLHLALEREGKLDKADRPGVGALIQKALTVKGKAPTGDLAEALFSSKLEDTATRVDLMKKATLADLKKIDDPLIRLALALRPMLKEVEEREESLSGRLAKVKPAYFAALREFSGKEIAPDANATLRLTYGTVRGYAPKPDAPIYRPFSTISEMIAKDTGKEPFEAPAKVKDAYRAKLFGPYVDAELGELPVDFLTDLHSTGGNSGSATLNDKGELCGLLFDGNYESLGSDWEFQPKIARSIHTDVRYVLWLLDAADGGDWILKEMGVTPAIP